MLLFLYVNIDFRTCASLTITVQREMDIMGTYSGRVLCVYRRLHCRLLATLSQDCTK